MARYAITILAIAAIIFAAAGSAGAASPEEPLELTVLSYNTHLFEDSDSECLCKCADFFKTNFNQGSGCKWDDFVFEDVTRRNLIASRIEASNADIVALQEV